MTFFDHLRSDLQCLASNARERHLTVRRGLDFSSNDYLGLATSARLRSAVRDAVDAGVAIGSGGSRLLRGNTPQHERLEQDAADFFGAESALFVGSGFAGNAMLFATLPQRGDLVLHDELVHASAHDGMRLGRADFRPFRHNDVEVVGAMIRGWRAEGGRGAVWIACESLYSMDGDQAPLARLIELADREGAVLLIDEAHATGVFGSVGRGLAADLQGRPNVVTLHTCGKALGVEGALILGPRAVRQFLINRGRPFVFSTASSPLMAEAVRAALRMLADEPERRMRLQTLVRYSQERLQPLGAKITGSPITPLIIGEDRRTMAVADALQRQGLDVRGVRPPTVQVGTSRLRISINLNICEADVDLLATALKKLL